MARITQVRLIDDLDGSEAADTVSFALDGRQYQLDLSEKNANRLRDALAPFVASSVVPTAVNKPDELAGRGADDLLPHRHGRRPGGDGGGSEPGGEGLEAAPAK